MYDQGVGEFNLAESFATGGSVMDTYSKLSDAIIGDYSQFWMAFVIVVVLVVLYYYFTKGTPTAWSKEDEDDDEDEDGEDAESDAKEGMASRYNASGNTLSKYLHVGLSGSENFSPTPAYFNSAEGQRACARGKFNKSDKEAYAWMNQSASADYGGKEGLAPGGASNNQLSKILQGRT